MKVEGVGYSDSFCFDEAFENAVQNLPKDDNPFPDKLIKITVESIGAELGGIAGFHRMVVRISAVY